MMDAVLQAILTNGASVVTVVIVGFWMIATGRLVTRREHSATEADRDFWREAALKGIGTAEKVVSERSVTVAAMESVTQQATER